MEANTSTATGSEKLKHLQKSLSNTENEKRVLAERLESNQQALAELRRNYQALQDQIQRLQTDLANNEVKYIVYYYYYYYIYVYIIMYCILLASLGGTKIIVNFQLLAQKLMSPITVRGPYSV